MATEMAWDERDLRDLLRVAAACRDSLILIPASPRALRSAPTIFEIYTPTIDGPEVEAW